MRFDVGPRRGAVEARVRIAPRGGMRLRRALPAPLIAAALATLLAGCDPSPRPDAALLTPQPPPRCDTRPESGVRKQAAAANVTGTATDANNDAAALRKLDYEAQCYRHAEMIARNRLNRLQAQVQDMARPPKGAPSTAP